MNAPANPSWAGSDDSVVYRTALPNVTPSFEFQQLMSSSVPAFQCWSYAQTHTTPAGEMRIHWKNWSSLPGRILAGVDHVAPSSVDRTTYTFASVASPA